MNGNYTTQEVNTADLKPGDLILEAYDEGVWEVLEVKRHREGATTIAVYPLNGGIKWLTHITCREGATQQKLVLR